MGALTLARRKATQGKRATVPLTVKGSPEWREWVEKVAEHNRTDLSTLIDAALVKFAREIGVPEPPPKR